METAMTRIFASLAAMILLTAPLRAEPVGEVDTAFKLLGANHKIVVEAFDDPKIDGVTCFLSMAKKGGISGSLGLAEDPSDASIACRQVGPIRFREAIESDEEGERVFHARRSVLFKKLQVEKHADLSRLQRQAHRRFAEKRDLGGRHDAVGRQTAGQGPGRLGTLGPT
jgi:CreA protein